MAPRPFGDFKEIWFEDFEFQIVNGGTPVPVCLVAKELISGRSVSLWQDELEPQTSPPFRIDKGVLHVSYFSTAELGCYLSLGWPVPAYQLDLWVEFRAHTNGRLSGRETGLLKALSFFGIETTETEYKEFMRELILRGNWSEEEKREIFLYCESDVDALIHLFEEMKPHIDLNRALFRGHYMKSVARMERNGVPIDSHYLEQLQIRWETIKEKLIQKIDKNYDVFSGLSFKERKFSEYLERENIPWPQSPTGRLILNDDTFKLMTTLSPNLAQLRELRRTLSSLRTIDLPVSKGRNRTLLSPFSAITGRNQPSNSKFIFGLPSWVRHLIRPGKGHSLAYIDYSQQEIGIAASLSGDKNMIEAYESGDFYLTFAKMAGAVPKNATKYSHPLKRAQFKECALGVSYGLGYKKLSEKADCSDFEAQELLKLHKKTFSRFWQWAEGNIDQTMLGKPYLTCFGWPLQYGPRISPRTLLNYPMQANGAEILRLACVLLHDHGIKICAPVHDALLIEASIQKIHEVATLAQKLMHQASRILLKNLTLRTDVDFIHYPDRMVPSKGNQLLNTVSAILKDIEAKEPVRPSDRGCSPNARPVQSNTISDGENI